MDARAELGCPSTAWGDGQERRFQAVLRWVDPDGRRVLDVGCGVGMYTAAFGRRSRHVVGVEFESGRARQARREHPRIGQAQAERLCFASGSFDIVFSHEVLEHVSDDRASAAEMVRVTRRGGRIVVFVPNRLYPFETHGIYWRGRYRFGNVVLVNYLPSALRNRLAPHVRAYTVRSVRRLFGDLPVRVVHHAQVFPGYDKLASRVPVLARLLRLVTYTLERTPLRRVGLSHLLVLERT